MDIFNTIKNIGTSAVPAAPGGSFIVGAVNAFLPDDQKLDADATGPQVKQVVERLTPEQRVILAAKRIDWQIIDTKERYATARAVIEADSNNPQFTRPHIAQYSFWLITLLTR